MTTTTDAPPEQARLEHVALTAIKAHPDNPRQVVGDVTDLAASIESVGLLEPLVVAPAYDGLKASAMGKATYLLIAGHRRLAAAKKAKHATVPVLVRADLTTRAGQVEAMLVENLQRTDLTPVEEADAYQLVMDLEGLTQKALAAKVGQPPARISERLKLTRIGDPARQALQAHQVTIDQALTIAEFDDDPAVQKKILKAVGTDNFRYEVNRAAVERERKQEIQARLARLEKNGVTVLPDKPAGARELFDLIEGFPSRYGWTEKQIDDAEKKLHRDCPGRVTYWATEYGTTRLYHGCTKPKLHPKAKPVKSDAEVQHEAEQAAARDALRTSAAAAAASRAQFIRDRIASPADPVTVRARLQALVIDTFDLDHPYNRGAQYARLFLDVLGAPVPEVQKGSDDAAQAADVAEALTEAMQGLGVNALVFALDLATHIAGEAALQSTQDLEVRSYTYSEARPWTAVLTEYGYGWSDWERDRFRGHSYCAGEPMAWDVDGDKPAEDPAGEGNE